MNEMSGVREEISGGYCGGVPPLPIPNREVKPTGADGTAMQCGRVGNRLLLQRSHATSVVRLLFSYWEKRVPGLRERNGSPLDRSRDVGNT